MRSVFLQIECAYPGWRVWCSDEGWWYATRVEPRARGDAVTVYGAGPDELTAALAEEESDWLRGRRSTSSRARETPT